MSPVICYDKDLVMEDKEKGRLSDATMKRLKEGGFSPDEFTEEQISALETMEKLEKQHWATRTLTWAAYLLWAFGIGGLLSGYFLTAAISVILGLFSMYTGYRIQKRIALRGFINATYKDQRNLGKYTRDELLLLVSQHTEKINTLDNDLGRGIHYLLRGQYYRELEMHPKAIDDLTNAISLLKKVETNDYRDIASAHFFRGCSYERVGRNIEAKSDFFAACNMGHEEACARLKMQE